MDYVLTYDKTADFPEILMQPAWTAPILWMRCHRSIRPLAPEN